MTYRDERSSQAVCLLVSPFGLLAALLLVGFTGCEPPGARLRAEREQKEAAAAESDDQPRVVVRRRRPRRAPPKRLRSYPKNDSAPSSLPTFGSNADNSFSDTWQNQDDTGYSGPKPDTAKTLERVWSELADATGLGPTEICWLVDVSPSARAWHGDLVGGITDYYSRLDQQAPQVAKNLSTRVGVFADSLKWLTPKEDANHSKVAELWQSLPAETSATEQTFAAIASSVALLRNSRLKLRKEVVLVVVTDEPGNDDELLTEVLPDLKKYGIPVFVLGVPAPFGRRAVTSQTSEGGTDDIPRPGKMAVVAQGPETIEPERIHLMFPDSTSAYDRIDSGFGPYALEQLCSETGGRFYGIYSGYGGDASWPTHDVLQFDPTVMKRYRPKLQSRGSYEQFLAKHKCCAVLTQAAKLGPIPVLMNAQTTFTKGDPPKLKNEVDVAQQAAAKVELEINTVYDLLKQGLADRKQLTDRRWCASYDLALGRIAAAKARVDGYNAMLAALKRGVPEKNKDATLWALAPAETTDLTSSLRTLIKQAREHLERVVKEHPGTPWAYLAKEELRTPLGWEWQEQ